MIGWDFFCCELNFQFYLFYPTSSHFDISNHFHQFSESCIIKLPMLHCCSLLASMQLSYILGSIFSVCLMMIFFSAQNCFNILSPSWLLCYCGGFCQKHWTVIHRGDSLHQKQTKWVNNIDTLFGLFKSELFKPAWSSLSLLRCSSTARNGFILA